MYISTRRKGRITRKELRQEAREKKQDRYIRKQLISKLQSEKGLTFVIPNGEVFHFNRNNSTAKTTNIWKKVGLNCIAKVAYVIDAYIECNGRYFAVELTAKNISLTKMSTFNLYGITPLIINHLPFNPKTQDTYHTKNPPKRVLPVVGKRYIGRDGEELKCLIRP